MSLSFISIRVIDNARNEVRNEEGCGAINPGCSGTACGCGHSRYAERVVAEECKKSGVSVTELGSGGRRGRLRAVRTRIVRGLVENYGVGVAEVARRVGISTSGV